MSEYAKNTNTGRLIKKSTSLYKKLKKLNQVEEINDAVEATEKLPIKKVEIESDEPEYDESTLQTKLAEISTTIIKDNLKAIVKAQKLTDAEMDIMLKKLLFKKLCIDEPKSPKKVKKVKKPKYKLVEPSDSESSESD
jgi:hypothetical protein